MSVCSTVTVGFTFALALPFFLASIPLLLSSLRTDGSHSGVIGPLVLGVSKDDLGTSSLVLAAVGRYIITFILYFLKICHSEVNRVQCRNEVMHPYSMHLIAHYLI